MNIIFKIQIFFEGSHKEMRPHSDESIDWLKSKGFDVRNSDWVDTFFVYYEGQNEAEKIAFRKRLDQHLLALSERNSSDCALIITEEFLNHEESRIQTWFLVPPSNLGMKYFEEFTKSNPEFHKKLKELRLFYAQLESRTKLIYGLSLLDKWFDPKPKHCLTKEEIEIVIENVSKIEIDEEKIKKIIEVIKDPSRLSEKSKNFRIAEAVQKYAGLNLKETEDKIRELYKARGKSAHSTVDNELEKNLNFLKSLFRAFLYMEYKFIELNLH